MSTIRNLYRRSKIFIARNFVWIGIVVVVVAWLVTLTLPWPCVLGHCEGFYTISDQGTFGDKFGAVTALFTGMSVIGIIYAIIQQDHQLRMAKRELKATRDMLDLARSDAEKTKEILDNQVQANKAQTDQIARDAFNTSLHNSVNLILQTEAALSVSPPTGGPPLVGKAGFGPRHLVHELLSERGANKAYLNQTRVAEHLASHEVIFELFITTGNQLAQDRHFEKKHAEFYLSAMNTTQKVAICWIAYQSSPSFQEFCHRYRLADHLKLKAEARAYFIGHFKHHLNEWGCPPG